MAGGRLGRGPAGRRGAGERPARTRCREGRGLRDARPHLPRMGAVRLRARRWSAQSGLRSTHRARRATWSTCSSSRTRVGVLVEDEEQRAKVADVDLRYVIAFAELDSLRADGRVFAAGPAGRARRARRLDRRGRLFTFIYTSGTTGPPKACMIRHRNYYAMVQKGDELGAPDPCGRRHAALPAARPQLRATAPSLGRLHRLHDRVPARPVTGRRRAAARAPDDLPECAARVREDPRGRDGAVRRAPRAPEADRRLGARRRTARVPPPPGRQAGSGDAGRYSTGWPTGSSTRRSRSASVDGFAS